MRGILKLATLVVMLLSLVTLVFVLLAMAGRGLDSAIGVMFQKFGALFFIGSLGLGLLSRFVDHRRTLPASKIANLAILVGITGGLMLLSLGFAN